jgi:ElaB/YqjD/DUF883 family membrane-anchored ribosome-binding protein
MSKHDKHPSDDGPEPTAPEASGGECGNAWADVHSAGDAVRLAKGELHKAQEFYQRVRRETADRVEAVRNKTVGDLLDDTLGVVRKHPVTGLTVALAVGVFLGRLLKKG